MKKLIFLFLFALSAAAYEFDSYYLWVDTSVTKQQVKNFCTNKDIPLRIIKQALRDADTVTANGVMVKITWSVPSESIRWM